MQWSGLSITNLKCIFKTLYFLKGRQIFKTALFPFRHKTVFHEVIEDEDPPLASMSAQDILGEWKINHTELHFGKKIVESAGTNISHGKWHGDVVIHTFDTNEKIDDYLRNIKALMHIRHENIVSFMGASTVDDLGLGYIITNPVRAESLHAKSSGLASMPVITKMSIACQVANALGYLHAKDITHGRLCSRNVFLEPKVQLSLLDYAIGHQNTAYSSPQVLSNQSAPKTIADDIFAFGTLIFEIFSGKLPFNGSHSVVKKEILANQIHSALDSFPCTNRLKKVIQVCWQFQACHRLPISAIRHNFAPGSCLVRRHSSSEPRLDQLHLKKLI